ncbi:hypothetical protein [Lactiplantibacillus plantarum]|uniref:hypothetical protein n=1 Tax=Lactiplantibacillus plantarum TaxID=1590 RepID=UPI00265F884A|nr:hypothetical protein [Lactiplantibacillus plantarum]MDO1603233.1 hypothetical protein [Lactiplantibacillus plantarum]
MTISEKKRLIFAKAVEATSNTSSYIDVAMIAAGMGYLLKKDMDPWNFNCFISELPNWMKSNARYGMPIKTLACNFNEMCSEYSELADDVISDKECALIEQPA